MKENNTKLYQPRKSDEILKELYGRLEEAPIGSPLYLAASDYLRERILIVDNRKIRNSIGKEEDLVISERLKSKLRINEYETALLSHQMHNRRSSMFGYESSYWCVLNSAEAYTDEVCKETDEGFSDILIHTRDALINHMDEALTRLD
jgi:hypothetical protein